MPEKTQPTLMPLLQAMELLWPNLPLDDDSTYFGCLDSLHQHLRSGAVRAWGKKAGQSKFYKIAPEYWANSEIDSLGDGGQGGAHPIFKWGEFPLFAVDFDKQSYKAVRFSRDDVTALLDKKTKEKPPTARRGPKRGRWCSNAAEFIRWRCQQEGLEYLDSPIGEIGKDVKKRVNRDYTHAAVKNSLPRTRQGIEKGIKKLIPEIRDSLLHQ